MDSRSAEEPFLPLKELSARLDTEITNAANRLEGRGVRSPACAMKIFDRAATVEAQMQQIKCRLKIAVKEEEASIAALKECLRQVDRDNQETLEKLMPLGLKVPEDLLPVIQQMPLEAAAAEPLSSSEEFVGNLNPLFKDEVVRSSQLPSLWAVQAGEVSRRNGRRQHRDHVEVQADTGHWTGREAGTELADRERCGAGISAPQ